MAKFMLILGGADLDKRSSGNPELASIMLERYTGVDTIARGWACPRVLQALRSDGGALDGAWRRGRRWLVRRNQGSHRECLQHQSGLTRGGDDARL
jgi:hypothetical protein